MWVNLTNVIAGRIMKHLAAMGVITETGSDEYRATGFSKVLTVEKYSDAFPLMYPPLPIAIPSG
jgi:hypothetical protein